MFDCDPLRLRGFARRLHASIFHPVGVVALLLTSLIGLAGCADNREVARISDSLGNERTVATGASLTLSPSVSVSSYMNHCGYSWQRTDQNSYLGNEKTLTFNPVLKSLDGAKITFSVTCDDGSGDTSEGSFDYTLHVYNPVVISTPPANQTITVGQTATFTVVATGDAPLSYQWYKDGVSITGATSASYATPAATAPGTAQYAVNVSNPVGAQLGSATLTVNPIDPQLTWNAVAAHTYGDAPFTVSATSLSPGAIAYSVQSGPATVSGNTVTLTGGGSVQLLASQAASGNYGATTAATSFTVNPATTTLNFASIPAHNYGDAPFTISATSASPGAVTYSVLSGPATVSGNTVTLTGAGTVQLQATQAATSNYKAASATASFSVTAPTVTISPITPANQTMAPGDIAFSATVTGGVSHAVTWQASSGSITSAGLWSAPNTTGNYTITATSVDNPAVSVNTTATISLPVILTQPVSKTVCVGYPASLTVGANYATSYAWSKGGSALGSPSANPELSFSSPVNTDSGAYSVQVSNGAGSLTSRTALLNVVTPVTLAISNQPTSATVYATQTATFAVSATGAGALTYQWYKNGAAISGATSSAYTTGALSSDNDGERYYVTVTDADCTNTTLTSNTVTLNVSTADTAVPPTIVTHPQGAIAAINGTATFTVTASGSGTLSYQWYRVPYAADMATAAGQAISGATSAHYDLDSSSTYATNDGDQYYVVVSNNFGTAVSQRATLAVGSGLYLNQQPATQYIPSGSMATYSVNALCAGCTPQYAWYLYAPKSNTAIALSDGAISSGNALDSYLDGAVIAGSNTAQLSLSNAPLTASGSVLYAVATATDGSTQIAGTHPLLSKTAGLFVQSLGSIGASTAGSGLCNDMANNVSWVLNGYKNSALNASVAAQDTAHCTITLTDGGGNEQAAVYWPTLISTANFSVAFTVGMSNSGNPGDGFTMILADPSQGATTHSLGRQGEGLGAAQVPGLVVGFDTYQNGNNYNNTVSCSNSNNTNNGACDPTAVSYMAVGQGAAALWENPWTNVNGYLDTQNSSRIPSNNFANGTHAYVVSVRSGVMTITMDGNELFTGQVALPPVAYLGFTASTGGATETVTLSALTATVSEP